MARMIRKQVYLDQKHDEMLKRRASERGVTEAEIIREALDASEQRTPDLSRRTVDPEAGRKLLESIHALARRRNVPRYRRSSRESFYADRIGRWTKS
jgi:hypothetical protein